MVLFYIFCWEQYSSSNALLYASWKSGFNFLMYLYHCCQNWNQSACKYIEILCLKQNSICSRTVREMFARCSWSSWTCSPIWRVFVSSLVRQQHLREQKKRSRTLRTHVREQISVREPCLAAHQYLGKDTKHNVFAAEVTALQMVDQYLHDESKCTTSNIYTDSQTAIKAINNPCWQSR